MSRSHWYGSKTMGRPTCTNFRIRISMGTGMGKGRPRPTTSLLS